MSSWEIRYREHTPGISGFPGHAIQQAQRWEAYVQGVGNHLVGSFEEARAWCADAARLADQSRRIAAWEGRAMILTQHERNEFQRAARSLSERGANVEARQLSDVADRSIADDNEYDRAARLYRAWLVFDEPRMERLTIRPL